MKYFIQTYGCKLNHADSSLLDIFLSEKHTKVVDISEADFVVINTCGVVETTSRKILKEAKELKSIGKIVILGGCLPETMRGECITVADGILNPTNINMIAEVVERVLSGEKVVNLQSNNLDKSIYIRDEKPSNTTSAIIAISEGCLGGCSYCVTKLARKKLISFNEENIILQIKRVLENGFKEIQLTSQDLAIYGYDKGKQCLPSLIKKINALDGDFRVKLGMMNPGFAMNIVDEVLNEMDNDRFYKFLHIPIQSGNDELLSKMKRGYTCNDFQNITQKIRDKFDDVILSTDVIVGHPLESEKMFLDTLEILKKTKPDIIHIFKFSKRPNTSDDSLKDLPDRIKKDRSRILTELFHKMNEAKNKEFAGRKEKVLVVEKRNDVFISRNNSGRAIILKENVKIGDFLDVKIVGSKWNYLEGSSIF